MGTCGTCGVEKSARFFRCNGARFDALRGEFLHLGTKRARVSPESKPYLSFSSPRTLRQSIVPSPEASTRHLRRAVP